MRVGSLFSGIGGIDLGLERAGFETAWFVENDPHCQKVLRRHWPDTPVYGDIHELTGDELEPVDMIAGGYPCQPFSVAGKRQGEDDERHLWPEMRRLIRLLRPRYVFAENVPGHLVLGLNNVLCDLAEDGFDAEWGVVSAQEMGAPHLRKRLFIVAHRNGSRLSRHEKPHSKPDEPQQQALRRGDAVRCNQDMAHRDGRGRQGCRPESAHIHVRSNDQADDEVDDTLRQRHESQDDALRRRHEPQDDALQAGRDPDIDASTGAAQPPMGRNPHGVPRGLDPHRWPAPPGEPQHPWEPPRTVADKVPNRVAQLKGLGNAVVPQVAEFVGNLLRSTLQTTQAQSRRA